MNSQYFEKIVDTLTEAIISNIKQKIGNNHLQIDKNELRHINKNSHISNDSFSIKCISSESIITSDNESISFEEIKDVRVLLSILAYLEIWYNKKSKEFIQIEWGIIDFESRASDLEENNEKSKVIYDRSKFAMGLKILEKRHDCNFGVCWNDIDDILDEYCRLDKQLATIN
jgi:hypothetical protein